MNRFSARICLAVSVGLMSLVSACGRGASLSSISIDPSTEIKVPLGLTQQFRAVGLYSDGTKRDVTNLVTWQQTGNPKLAAIDDRGLATTRQSGTTTLSASYAGASASVLFVVTEPLALSITIRPNQATVAQGVLTKLEAIATFTNGVTRDAGTSAFWRSSNDSILEVEKQGGGRGYVIGVAQSSEPVTITATIGKVSSATVLTVAAPLKDDWLGAGELTCQEARLGDQRPVQGKVARNDCVSFGECMLIDGGSTFYSADYFLSPGTGAHLYLRDFQKQNVPSDGKVRVVVQPRSGEITYQGRGNYLYRPNKQFRGFDSAVFVVEVQGMELTNHVWLNVLGSGVGGTDGYDPYEDKKYCPRGAFWPITSANDALLPATNTR
jgi:Bacterial Ig-like domain (group 2)